MKKIVSQIIVAAVCALLGFMLTYQFKLLTLEDKKSISNPNNPTEITAEIEALKKQKADLEKQNSELINQIKALEDSSSQSEISKEIKSQLDVSRLLLGTRDVVGSGIVLTLTPNSNVFSPNTSQLYINHEELIHIINELNFAGAEAVSVNDNRITSQSGLRTSGGNNSYIAINNDRISPKDKIIIKAIGDKSMLASALEFQGVLEFGALQQYKVKIDKDDNILIPKYTKAYKYDNLKPAK